MLPIGAIVRRWPPSSIAETPVFVSGLVDNRRVDLFNRRYMLTSGQQELLRWLALLAMVIDHIGVIFLPPEWSPMFRATGRIAWPLFAVLLAYNVAVRGVDPRRYLLRLAVFAVIAQLPHTLAFGWVGISIMGTLFLGALSLSLLERRIPNPPVALLLVAVVLFGANFVEYGLQGILLVVAVWWAFKTNAAVAWLAAIVAVGFVNVPSNLWPHGLLAIPVALIASSLLVGLPRSGLLPWMFYPGHLLVLVLIRELMG